MLKPFLFLVCVIGLLSLGFSYSQTSEVDCEATMNQCPQCGGLCPYDHGFVCQECQIVFKSTK